MKEILSFVFGKSLWIYDSSFKCYCVTKASKLLPAKLIFLFSWQWILARNKGNRLSNLTLNISKRIGCVHALNNDVLLHRRTSSILELVKVKQKRTWALVFSEHMPLFFFPHGSRIKANHLVTKGKGKMRMKFSGSLF